MVSSNDKHSGVTITNPPSSIHPVHRIYLRSGRTYDSFGGDEVAPPEVFEVEIKEKKSEEDVSSGKMKGKVNEEANEKDKSKEKVVETTTRRNFEAPPPYPQRIVEREAFE